MILFSVNLSMDRLDAQFPASELPDHTQSIGVGITLTVYAFGAPDPPALSMDGLPAVAKLMCEDVDEDLHATSSGVVEVGSVSLPNNTGAQFGSGDPHRGLTTAATTSCPAIVGIGNTHEDVGDSRRADIADHGTNNVIGDVGAVSEFHSEPQGLTVAGRAGSLAIVCFETTVMLAALTAARATDPRSLLAEPAPSKPLVLLGSEFHRYVIHELRVGVNVSRITNRTVCIAATIDENHGHVPTLTLVGCLEEDQGSRLAISGLHREDFGFILGRHARPTFAMNCFLTTEIS